MKYFVNDWYADNAIMYSLLEELTLYGGQERAGKPRPGI